jgi:RNA-directed DNA polymerase
VRWPIRQWQPKQLSTPSAIERWQLPDLANLDALADWCQLSMGDLIWYGQCYRQAQKPKHEPNKKLQHYHYQFITKSNGKPRLLETPKARLKALQQKIHHQILSRVPVHRAAHGFVAGRSIKSFACAHVARRYVLAMDLKDFFVSIQAGRIVRVFQALGYSFQVSKVLMGLCMNRTPQQHLHALSNLSEIRHYRQPHLPQGAPSSPALANLAAFHLDCRLQGAANKLGFAYSRYADDLAFSSDEVNQDGINQLIGWVKRIATSEGFTINPTKTRVMNQSQRQQLAGVVVNEKQSLNRHNLKQFEALLFNCVRYGPESQNRAGHPRFKAHLQGRLAFYLDVAPHKCRKLAALYDSIMWEAEENTAVN